MSSCPLFAIQVTETWLLISFIEKKLEMVSRPYPPSSCCSSGRQRHWFTALMRTLLHQHNVLLIYGSHWAWFIYNCLGKKYERGWCVLVGEVCCELKPRNDKTRQTGQFEALVEEASKLRCPTFRVKQWVIITPDSCFPFNKSLILCTIS